MLPIENAPSRDAKISRSNSWQIWTVIVEIYLFSVWLFASWVSARERNWLPLINAELEKKAFPSRRWGFLFSWNSDWRGSNLPTVLFSQIGPFGNGIWIWAYVFSPSAEEQAQLVQVFLRCLGVCIFYFLFSILFSIIWTDEFILQCCSKKKIFQLKSVLVFQSSCHLWVQRTWFMPSPILTKIYLIIKCFSKSFFFLFFLNKKKNLVQILFLTNFWNFSVNALDMYIYIFFGNYTFPSWTDTPSIHT
jgi:hypothetical protein